MLETWFPASGDVLPQRSAFEEAAMKIWSSFLAYATNWLQVRLAVIAIAVIAGGLATPNGAHADDIEQIYALGKVAKELGAVEYDVSGWHSRLDITISSVLPGDARRFLAGTCEELERKFSWESNWTVRVFLTVGDRPAAQCEIRASR